MAELLPVLTLLAPTAMVLLIVRYLNLRDARRESANITAGGDPHVVAYPIDS